jgi:hypothetical protein
VLRVEGFRVLGSGLSERIGQAAAGKGGSLVSTFGRDLRPRWEAQREAPACRMKACGHGEQLPAQPTRWVGVTIDVGEGGWP